MLRVIVARLQTGERRRVAPGLIVCVLVSCGQRGSHACEVFGPVFLKLGRFVWFRVQFSYKLGQSGYSDLLLLGERVRERERERGGREGGIEIGRSGGWELRANWAKQWLRADSTVRFSWASMER
jgi:hypothetical protein